MGQSAIYSACLHFVVLLLAVLGVPNWLKSSLPIIEKTVVIEIVDPDWLKTVQMTSATNLPQRIEQALEIKKPEPLAPYPPALPKPDAQPVPLKQEYKHGLQPKQKQELPPSLLLLPKPPELPKPNPKPESKPEPKIPEPPKSVLQKQDSPSERKDIKESRSDSFDTLLKNVEKLAKTEKVEKEDRKTKPSSQNANMINLDLEKTITGLIAAGSTQYSQDLPLSLSEIDSIRAQIEWCWNVPAGARDAENLIIEIKVQFAPDGKALHAQLIEDKRYHIDSFYRAAADSAKRAVYQCSPIKAPLTKYERWREVKLRFNPREMLGP